MGLSNLVKLHLLTLIDDNRKLLYLILTYLAVISIQFYRFTSLLAVEDLSGTALEMLFYSFGGIQDPVRQFHFLTSIILITSPVIYVQTTKENYEELEMLVLNRIESRKKWWSSLVISNLIFSLILTILLVALVLIIGVLFFNGLYFSNYSAEFYPNWIILNLSPLTIIFILWVNMFLGFNFLLNLLSLIQLKSVHKSAIFISFTTIVISTIFLGVFDLIPNVYLIGLYPTILNVNPSKIGILSSIFGNFALFILTWKLGKVFSMKI